MSHITDEQLAAYLDGELAPDARRRVEQALDADPATAQRLAALAMGDQALRKAFSAVADEAPPARLLQALQLDQARQQPQPRRRWPRAGLAIAASVLVAVAAAMLWPVGNAPPVPEPLQVALERQPSGEPLVVPRDGDATIDIQVLRTVQTKDGTYCRDFEVTELHGGTVVAQQLGTACRTGGSEARWTVVDRRQPPPPDGAGGDYALAGTGNVQGRPLSVSQEQSLIDSRWAASR